MTKAQWFAVSSGNGNDGVARETEMTDDTIKIHVARQTLSDGSHVYDVFVKAERGAIQIAAVNEQAAFKISNTLSDMLEDDSIALATVKTSCNY
jgi:hypothetical protein